MSAKILLEIEQDQKYEFFQKYDALGDLQKQIWCKIVDYCKAYPCAFPKQAKIAQEEKCSRKHVNRTFKKFIEFGWLKLKARGARRTKILIVPDSFIQIDVINRKYFKRVEVTRGSEGKVTSGGSHNTFNKKKETSTEAGEIAIPHYLEKLPIPWDSKLKLSLLPENIYQETLYQCEKKARSGFFPDDQVKYFVGTAVKMAQKNGIRIDWIKYYKTLDRGMRI